MIGQRCNMYVSSKIERLEVSGFQGIERELHLFALIINYKVLSSTQQELPEATPKANAFTVPPVAAPELLHQQYCHLSSLSVFHLGSSRRVIPRA